MGYVRVLTEQVESRDHRTMTVREQLHRWEPLIEAWACIDEVALASLPAASGPGLQGAPFAVKDVIDAAGLPTRCGSDALIDAAAAAQDAPVVAALRRAGAIPVGKARTTEFAFVDPTITRNPHDTARSPGGSSSGSAAVVGAGIVPFALGTQTAGSLCRPAVYCGVASYKPSIGAVPVSGMAPLSPSFDAIGVIAASMAWLTRVFGCLASAFDLPPLPAPAARPLRIGFVTTSEQAPGPEMRRMMQAVIVLLRGAGHRVAPVAAPVSFSAVIAQHRIMMLAEAANGVGARVAGREILLQPRLRAGLQDGRQITPGQYATAQAALAEARDRFWQSLGAFDLLLAYPVPDAAPVGLASTGDQSYLTPWTAMGGPLVSLPSGLNSDGMPLGILLAAAPGRDAALVSAACDIAGLLPPPAAARFPGS